MNIVETDFKDLFVCTPKLVEDQRGYFFESFNLRIFQEKTGLNINFVQDNQSKSGFGVLRGLHMQGGEHAQAKLVRVLTGKVLDVAVDLRPDEPTFGRHFSIELSAANKQQLYIPRGFAHGFVVLSDTAEFFYKCDNYYYPESEMGIIYNDEEFEINWGLTGSEIQISTKDSLNKSFKEIKKKLI